MRGAEVLLECLKREGVDVIFGISGGAILPIYDALGQQQDIWSILTRHEQGAGHMAEGYAHVTGRPGVRLRPSGAPQTFMKVGPRNAMVIAVCSLALSAHRERGELRASFGSAGPVTGLVTAPLDERESHLRRIFDVSQKELGYFRDLVLVGVM